MLTPSVPGLRSHSRHKMEVTAFWAPRLAPRGPLVTPSALLRKAENKPRKTFVKKTHKRATLVPEPVRERPYGGKLQPLDVRLRTLPFSHLRLFINLSQRRHTRHSGSLAGRGRCDVGAGREM